MMYIGHVDDVPDHFKCPLYFHILVVDERSGHGERLQRTSLRDVL